MKAANEILDRLENGEKPKYLKNQYRWLEFTFKEREALIQKAEEQNRDYLVRQLTQKQQAVVRARRISYLLGVATALVLGTSVYLYKRHFSGTSYQLL